jgi:proton-dependent oligopeptide transporter, POT family
MPAIPKHDGGEGTMNRAAGEATSNIGSNSRDGDSVLPTDVCESSQLGMLPKECLSTADPDRPLRHVDGHGRESLFSLRPLAYSVGQILLVELLERFSFYGIFYTQTLFLTGSYSRPGSEEWDPGFTSVEASTMVSVSTAVAYTTPFLGAYLADSVFGDYRSILIGIVVFYLPGVALITATTIPYLLGDEFHTGWLIVGLTVLWPLGTGMIKSVVNVFGARQHHPILQSALVERYYVSFYVAINTGALAGITAVPILAQHNVTTAYLVPACALVLGLAVFAWGTPRYVISSPVTSVHRKKSSASTDISLLSIFRISLLIVPFAIAYSQMPTTFIIQGSVMGRTWGVIDAATMNAADAASVLVFGHLVGHKLYPALAKRGWKIPTSYKFAIGSALAFLAVAWAMVVESLIRSAYRQRGEPISVVWQAPSYILIGAGEIFAVSTAYEAAFTASPPASKALASAINIFCIGGLPNLVCIFLYRACRNWFVSDRSGTANLTQLRDYTAAHVSYYFGVLLVILAVGILVNAHPRVRAFVESVEERALEVTKTPLLATPRQRRLGADEESPLLGALKRQDPQFGQHPTLNRMGSMRAGPTAASATSPTSRTSRGIKYKYIPRLYGTTNTSNQRATTTTPPRQVLMSPDGRPIRALDMMRQPATTPTTTELVADSFTKGRGQHLSKHESS